MVAGALLLDEGALALQTRWAPATLALVHVFTLGMLGNAMFGSLLQFLPAAAGVRVRGGTRAGWALFGLLNAGTLLLVAGFRAMRTELLLAAAPTLALAFALLGAIALPGLLARVPAPVSQGKAASAASAAVQPTRIGIAFAVCAALVTAALGVAMLLRLTGRGGLPLLPWADVHAGWGVLGWALGLLASVGAVVLPMFQGTRALPAKAQFVWLRMLGAVLLIGLLWAAFGQGAAPLRWGGAACLALFAMAGLWLQWRAPHSRNAWLVRFWRVALLALLMAAGVLAAGGPPVLLGVLVLGIALPWLVAGMQMEIVAFLGWIELHRRCGRGVRLPAVQTLLPEAHKAGVFAAHAIAAMALLAAAMWPTPLGARVAGIALAASQALLWLRLHGISRCMRRFLTKAAGSARETGDVHAH